MSINAENLKKLIAKHNDPEDGTDLNEEGHSDSLEDNRHSEGEGPITIDPNV